MIQTLLCIGYVVAYLTIHFGDAPPFANICLITALVTATIIGILQGNDFDEWHQRGRSMPTRNRENT
jgi:hypothetical protein